MNNDIPLRQREFGDEMLPTADEVQSLEINGFEDDSWHNNICVSFTKAYTHHGRPDGRCLTLWLDAVRPEDREMTAERFLLQSHNAYDDYVDVLRTDSFDEVMVRITALELAALPKPMTFYCNWDDSYAESEKTVTSTFFTLDMGYSYADIGSIMMLEVGEAKSLDDGHHTVTRIK